MKMQRPPAMASENKLDIIRLKDGDGGVTGMVIGDFHTYYAKYNGKFFEYATRGTEGAKFRFRVNFAVKEGANWVLRVIENGSMLYERFFDLNEESPLDETVVTVKRKGSGQNDTEYTVVPSGKVKLTKEDAAFLATLKPIDLRLEEEKTEDKFNEI